MRGQRRQRLGIALFPLAALAMHQLRYELAFGSDASRQLAAHGHGYVQAVTPLVVLAAALGAGGWLARLAGAWRSGGSGRDERGRGLPALWALAAAALLCIYVGQESLEALFATGHPHGLAGILGHGGLWALPAAIVIGGLLALTVHGGRALIAHVARIRRPPRRAVDSAPRRGAHPAPVALPRLAPLAGGRAGRAPPVAASRRGGLRPARV
jgi:hypothetical protein